MNDRTAKPSGSLEEIFCPRGIAVVGVSASKLAFAELVVHALQGAQYPAIYPVNPKYEEVLGLRCYPSVTAIPEVVDHVIVNIPAESVLKLLDECAEKGVKSVHFFTAGFGESGYRDRADLEKEMLVKAKAGGFRIIGPNCVGLYVPKNRVVNWIGDPVEPGPIGFISQSGGHAQNLPHYSRARGLRFSKVVSYGNALDVNESELLDYLAEDGETEIIAAYIEGVKDGMRFSRALENAASRKPVVIYKGGRSEAGRRAAHGHTASLTSSVAVFDALCRQVRAILVDDLDEMIDVLTAIRFMKPLPRGGAVALVGAGGGPSVLAGDGMEKEGLRLPGFSFEVQEALKKVLPVAGSIFINPLDTPNLATVDAIRAALQVLGGVPELDLAVYHLGFHPISRWGLGRMCAEDFLNPVVQALQEAARENGKPVLLALRPPQDLDGMKEFLTVQEAFVGAGFPVFHSMRKLARSVARVVSWNQKLSRDEG
jgi:acyl-CoA synthetase (NDP forming)